MMKVELNRTPIHTVIIGASGHARVIADIIRCSGDIVDGFLDDREANQFPELNIIGRVDDAKKIALDSPNVRFVIGIGKNQTREKIANRLGNLNYHTSIHPSAVVACDVTIGVGSVVMANAVINTGSVIGTHTIINTAATVDHDCRIDDFVHLSPGVHLSGTVGIGFGSWLGTGAVTSNNVNICGGGTVVRKILWKIIGIHVGDPAERL